MRRAASLSCLVLATCLLVLPGCGGGESTHEVTDVRDRAKPRVVVPPTTTTAERFGYRRPGRGGHGSDPHAGIPGMGGGTTARAKAFQWKTPEGWEEAKGSSSRDGTWRVKGEPQTDCSLSKLRGTGGGMVANVNRWRDQMGAAPLDAAAVAALPRKPLLGAEAVYVDIPGSYGGMRGGKTKLQDARMLGYLLELPSAAVFLKFVGPAKVVEANQGAFEQLAASIQIAAHGGGTPPEREGPETSGRPTFSWALPASWEAVKGRPGRVVTVAPKGAKQTQCYLYLLGGDGGGLNLNINRWRSQMRQKDLTAAEIGALERIDVLGTKAVLVAIDGPFSGQSGEKIAGAKLFGLVILKEDYLLTVKMQGPAEEMKGEWANFVAFCKSIKRK